MRFPYSGLLRSQDLQEAKDQLISDLADSLSMTRPCAETLLRQHEWSREAVLDGMRLEPSEARTGVLQHHSQSSLPPIGTLNEFPFLCVTRQRF